jgi:hypothetical protein
LGQGWIIDALHQAISIIEARQGWAPEPGAIYEATTAGEVRERSSGQVVRSIAGEQLRRKGERARSAKQRRSTASWHEASNVIARAATWEELHAQLKALGASYRQKGSGAVVCFASGTEIKLSAVAGVGHKKVVERLGPYRPDQSTDSELDYAYATFRRELRHANRAVREHRRAAWAQLDEARDELLWSPQLAQASHELRRKIAREHLAARRHLKHLYDSQLQRLANAACKTAEEFQRRGQPGVPGIELPTILMPIRSQAAEHVILAGYTREAQPFHEAYTRLGEAEPSILDFGSVLLIEGDRADLAAAIQLAYQRFGSVRITSDYTTCAAAHLIARELGFEITTVAQPGMPGASQTLPRMSPVARSPKGQMSPTVDRGVAENPVPNSSMIMPPNHLERISSDEYRTERSGIAPAFQYPPGLLGLFQRGLASTAEAARRVDDRLRHLPVGQLGDQRKQAGLLLPHVASMDRNGGPGVRRATAINRPPAEGPPIPELAAEPVGRQQQHKPRNHSAAEADIARGQHPSAPSQSPPDLILGAPEFVNEASTDVDTGSTAAREAFIRAQRSKQRGR